jgi:hypothetical protein
VNDILYLCFAVESHLSLGTERYGAFLGCVDRIILAEVRVLAWEGIEAFLSNDDRAKLGLFAGIELYAQVSWVRISTVFDCSARFFCCHGVVRVSEFIIILSPKPYALRMLRPRSIDHIRRKIKAWAAFIDRKDAYAVFIVIFVGISSFFLGRLSILEKSRPPVTLEQFSFGSVESAAAETVKKTPEIEAKSTISAPSQAASPVTVGKGVYVGSKVSDKYHRSDCPGALRISEINRVWFSSKTEAEQAGYSPASNCKGI